MCLASLQTAPPAIERSNKSKSQDQDGQHDDSPLHRTPSFNLSSHRGLTSHSRLQNLKCSGQKSDPTGGRAKQVLNLDRNGVSGDVEILFFRSCLSWSKSCTSWFWAFTVQGSCLAGSRTHLASSCISSCYQPLACVVWSVMWLQEEEEQEQEPEGPEVKASTNSVSCSVCSLRLFSHKSQCQSERLNQKLCATRRSKKRKTRTVGSN